MLPACTLGTCSGAKGWAAGMLGARSTPCIAMGPWRRQANPVQFRGLSRPQAKPMHFYGALETPGQPCAILWGLAGPRPSPCFSMGRRRHQVSPMQFEGALGTPGQPYAIRGGFPGPRHFYGGGWREQVNPPLFYGDFQAPRSSPRVPVGTSGNQVHPKHSYGDLERPLVLAGPSHSKRGAGRGHARHRPWVGSNHQPSG